MAPGGRPKVAMRPLFRDEAAIPLVDFMHLRGEKDEGGSIPVPAQARLSSFLAGQFY